tara:strand:- start:8707 stop:8883 length:177 start_codon:yes stop_codon:yes gene_type:complete
MSNKPRLIIQHHSDQWWVYHKVDEGDFGTDEYIFDTFEDVHNWVAIRYRELEVNQEAE